ncbi:MAG: Rieske 2Fe-2S domain-containing protein [Polyangiaceae bacterium]|nr:Rieske 2Fe-2S domain-containing protein [Polyangiaceae bacterium]
MKKLVGKVSLAEVQRTGLVRLDFPPYDVCVALVDGVPHAIEDGCNHAGASLSEGVQTGDAVTCPMHGYVFSLRSGELLAPRGLCGAQRRFLARIEGDQIVVEDDFALAILQK